MFSNDHIQVRRDGTIRYHKQTTSVPSLLSKVGASIVRDGSLGYIAGMHITSEERKEINLGTARQRGTMQMPQTWDV